MGKVIRFFRLRNYRFWRRYYLARWQGQALNKMPDKRYIQTRLDYWVFDA